VKLVLDASVAGKWLVPERDTDRARNLFDHWNDGRMEIIAPALLSAEIASMLSKRVARGFLQPADGLRLFQDFSHFGLALIPIESLARAALGLSVRYRHPVYDCLYVALAARERCSLVTADEKLFNAFAAVFPLVRLLADIEFIQ
jgi:predicted nucleic acid-binding protein